MANSDTEAQFPIDFDVDAEALDEGTASLTKLRDTIKGATEYIRQHNAALKSIKGSTEQVTKAREELKGKIEKARSSVSAYNLALLKQGVTYEKLIAKEKELIRQKEKEQQALAKTNREALSTAGGPLKSLISGYESLKSVLGGGGGVVLLLGLTVAAMAAVTVATIAGVAALARWTIGAANASRAMSIMREAASGSAENAQALGTQIDAIWRKVPTSAAALNELGSDITRTFAGSRVSGQGIVDTFAAVAQASSAMGDQVGSTLKGIIERGKTFGRVGLGLNELQGTGLNFDDVATELAKSMKTGVAQARQALVYGLAPVDAAANAIRAAVEKRFGAINGKKLLDLDTITQKFHDRLTKLASGFNLTPVLQSLSDLAELFDTSTVTGAALQQMVSLFGQALGATFKGGTPIIKAFFEQMIIGTQRAMIWALRFALFVKDNWEPLKKTFQIVALGISAYLLPAIISSIPAIASFAAGVIAATWPFLAIGAAIAAVVYGIFQLEKHKDALVQTFEGWLNSAAELGSNLADGLVNGIVNSVSRVVKAVENLGHEAWTALRKVWDAHSPSRLTFGLGEDIGEGKALGIEASAGRVAEAAATVGSAGAMASGAAAGGPGGGMVLHIGSVQVIVQGGDKDAQATGQAAARSFYAELLALVERLGESEGIPTQAAPA